MNKKDLRRSFSSASGSAADAKVGILAAEVYFPKTFVGQPALEIFDGVSKGKYTVGLEQDAMAFCGDREDIISMSMTVLQSLMEKYNINPKDIGRLEVGTETLIDKSKSIKSNLMQLFEKSGNTDIEGIDTINACYGGTSALLNSVNWCESSSWDGRYAVVVCGDIAVYEPGPARPSGGAATVALLIGPNAPITLETGIRASYMEHAYDFYKPNLASEYPVVDGKFSTTCYIRALVRCYQGFIQKYERKYGTAFTMSDANYAIFHSPFNKMIRRAYGRLLYEDWLRGGKKAPLNIPQLSEDESFEDKDRFIQKAFNTAGAEQYERVVTPSCQLPKTLGNSYTASLYTGLISLLSNANVQNQRVLMFSYGSGLAATLFSLQVNGSVEHIVKATNINNRLAQRIEVSPAEYTKEMKHRESLYGQCDFVPTSSPASLFPGTYYLDKVDALHRRFYKRTPAN